MSVANAMYTALHNEAWAEITTARATLLIYFTSPVGIGEHPQHLEEMTKLLDKISQAEDRIKALSEHFSEFGNTEQSHASS